MIIVLALVHQGCAPKPYIEGQELAAAFRSEAAIERYRRSISGFPDYRPAYVAIVALTLEDKYITDFQLAQEVLEVYLTRFGDRLSKRERERASELAAALSEKLAGHLTKQAHGDGRRPAKCNVEPLRELYGAQKHLKREQARTLAEIRGMKGACREVIRQRLYSPDGYCKLSTLKSAEALDEYERITSEMSATFTDELWAENDDARLDLCRLAAYLQWRYRVADLPMEGAYDPLPHPDFHEIVSSVDARSVLDAIRAELSEMDACRDLDDSLPLGELSDHLAGGFKQIEEIVPSERHSLRAYLVHDLLLHRAAQKAAPIEALVAYQDLYFAWATTESRCGATAQVARNIQKWLRKLREEAASKELGNAPCRFDAFDEMLRIKLRRGGQPEFLDPTTHQREESGLLLAKYRDSIVVCSKGKHRPETLRVLIERALPVDPLAVFEIVKYDLARRRYQAKEPEHNHWMRTRLKLLETAQDAGSPTSQSKGRTEVLAQARCASQYAEFFEFIAGEDKYLKSGKEDLREARRSWKADGEDADDHYQRENYAGTVNDRVDVAAQVCEPARRRNPGSGYHRDIKAVGKRLVSRIRSFNREVKALNAEISRYCSRKVCAREASECARWGTSKVKRYNVLCTQKIIGTNNTFQEWHYGRTTPDCPSDFNTRVNVVDPYTTKERFCRDWVDKCVKYRPRCKTEP